MNGSILVLCFTQARHFCHIMSTPSLSHFSACNIEKIWEEPEEEARFEAYHIMCVGGHKSGSNICSYASKTSKSDGMKLTTPTNVLCQRRSNRKHMTDHTHCFAHRSIACANS